MTTPPGARGVIIIGVLFSVFRFPCANGATETIASSHATCSSFVLTCCVAFSETGSFGLGPVRFVILGDGEVLWRSKVVRELRVIEDFTVDVARVSILELRVYAQEGNNTGSHAAWLDPYVTTKAGEP